MLKYFCSADIHSFFDEWIIALRNKGFDLKNPDHKIIVCGDLFDRGNQSRECYEFMKLLMEKNRAIYIRGNHEDLMLDAILDAKRYNIRRHHISNGAIRTIANMMDCSEYDLLAGFYDQKAFAKASEELLNFIDTSIDYYQLGDKVFVHGWIPTTVDANNNEIVHDNWRDGGWKQARWTCCFDAWGLNLLPPTGETVVCGHWHTSYGWSKFRNRSEWGPDAEFTPFIEKGIVALDACTAYTKMVNVVVFDEQGNLIDN